MTLFDETEIAQCIGCGCDDLHSCFDDYTENPCSWLRVDREQEVGVCSACPDQVELWDKGKRDIKVPG